MAKGKKTGGRDWKKGESGNPNGGPRLPSDVRAARDMSKAEFISTASRFLKLTAAELTAVAENPQSTALELVVASIIQKAGILGDHKRLNFFCEWMFGKLTMKHEHDLPQMTGHDLLMKVIEETSQHDSRLEEGGKENAEEKEDAKSR